MIDYINFLNNYISAKSMRFLRINTISSLRMKIIRFLIALGDLR